MGNKTAGFKEVLRIPVAASALLAHTYEHFETFAKINKFVAPKESRNSSMPVWVRLHSGKFWWKLSRSQRPGPALPGEDVGGPDSSTRLFCSPDLVRN
jgi:hypothetical protein